MKQNNDAVLMFFFFLMTQLAGSCGHKKQLTKSTTATNHSAAMPAVMDKCKKYDRVIIAGQPNESEINGLTAMGVTFVLNVRGYDQMNHRSKVNFDEDSLLRATGISYKNARRLSGLSLQTGPAGYSG